MFSVFLLSGVALLSSGTVVSINTQTPYKTMALCEAAAAQVRDYISIHNDAVAASIECRPHELPILPPQPEPLAPLREAR